MVTVLPAALALAILNAPVNELSEVTPPPPPGQAPQAGAPAVDNKHSPAPPAATELNAPAPLPTTTPLAVSEVAPVPPLATVKALPRPKDPVTLKLPPTVIVPPLWPRIESSIFCDVVNTGIEPTVPPPLETVPVPAPTTLTEKLPPPLSLIVTLGVPAVMFSTPVFCKTLLVMFKPLPRTIVPTL